MISMQGTIGSDPVYAVKRMSKFDHVRDSS